MNTQTKPITILMLYCATCQRDTKHEFNRDNFIHALYVCLCCGTERAA